MSAPAQPSLRNITALVAPLLLVCLSACSLLSPTVDTATRDDVASQAQRGMKMATARANLAASGFDCRTRSGSYFDADGQEHAADGMFASCTKPSGHLIHFACAQRPHVVLVPNGNRVARVIVDTQPSCTSTEPHMHRRINGH